MSKSSLLSLSSRRTVRYDAFISYSFGTDAELAELLRESLQRFANAWSPWRWANPVRSLKVFRDKSALSLEPLWPAIERALANSDWMVLLASTGAAHSPWIAREVAYWCAHKSSDRILLIQTDGVLSWDTTAHDFDWAVSTALPRRLAGYFTTEPLWLDLRWTKTLSRIESADPRFQDAVASIAAPIRRISKDELIGEDIRQHQHLRRWRNIAYFAITILLVGAISAAELARRQRSLALEREAEAVLERSKAEHQAEVALARQLAAQSVQTRLHTAGKIELSLLLAVESVRRDGSLEGSQALAQALSLTPERTDLFQHRWGEFQAYAMVLDIAFSPDGKLIASANEDGSVAVWRVGGEQVWHQQISDERIRKLAFHPRGEFLASAGMDGNVSLWNINDGDHVATFTHDAPATDIDFDTSGKFFATASEDGTARIWALDSGIEIGRMSFGDGDSAVVKDVAFSPDGRKVAAINIGGRVCLWELDGRRASGCMRTEGLGLHIAFAPDGKAIATASENFTIVWDVLKRQKLHRFEHTDLLGEASMAHFVWINDIAFHPGGRFLATASRDRTVRAWDLETGQEALRIVETSPIENLEFSPDGDRLATATATGTVRIWKFPNGRELFRIGQLSESIVQSLAFSPDGKQLAAANWRSEIGIWSLRSSLQAAQLPHPDDVERFAISQNGRFAATAADDNIIRLWKTADWSKIDEFKRFNTRKLQFLEDGRHLLIESLEGGLEILATGETQHIEQLLARPNGDLILTSRFALLHSQGRFEIWRVRGDEVVSAVLGHQASTDSFAVQGHSSILAVAYQDLQTIELWDIADAQKIATIPIQSKARRMAISPFGDKLVILHGERKTGAGRYDPLDYWFEIRHLPDGEITAEIHIGQDEPAFIQYLPDGERLLFATGDWRFPDDVHVIGDTGDNKRISLNDVGEVRTLRVAPDGDHIAISDGKRLRLWNLNTGLAVEEFPVDSSISTIAFSADGRHLATATGKDLTLWFWGVEPIEMACGHIKRNLSTKQWRDFLPSVPYRQTCPNLPVVANGPAED